MLKGKVDLLDATVAITSFFQYYFEPREKGAVAFTTGARSQREHD